MKTKKEFEDRWPGIMSDVPCGFWCPKGWTDRVWKLMEDIDTLLDGDLSGFKLDQVKEKFGGLRFYCYFEHKGPIKDEIQSLVNQAENDCWNICLTCGTTAGVTTEGPGWITSQCADCRKASRENPRTPRYE